jgi:hypothetical protein
MCIKNDRGVSRDLTRNSTTANLKKPNEMRMDVISPRPCWSWLTMVDQHM